MINTDATTGASVGPLPADRRLRLDGNLADVQAVYSEPANSHPARVRIRSALRTIERVLREPLERVPAQPELLGPLLAKANPAIVGVKPRQWRDVRYIVKRALRDVGVEVLSHRDTTLLTGEWERLHGSLSDRRLQIGLGKFIRFCERTGIPPHAVDNQIFEAFHIELATRSLHPNPREVLKQTVKLWNRAAELVPTWPRFICGPLPGSARIALPVAAFPQSFQEDLRRFLDAGERGDELDDGYAQRVREITTKGRRHMLLRLASALVHSGMPAEEIVDLSVLCQLRNARTAIRFFRDRHPSKATTEGMLGHVWLLRLVARSWVGDHDADRQLKEEILKKYDKDMKAARAGVRLKNRLKLRQFDHTSNLVSLVSLPDRVLEGIGRGSEPTYADSVRIMYALMISILLSAPVRSRNLVELETARDLAIVGKGRSRYVRMQLSHTLTKTRRPYEARLPSTTGRLLELWLTKHRPRVCPFSSPLLFPNSRGQLRNRSGLAAQLTKFIERETGLKMHLHLFRHLAAKIILEHDPTKMEAVRQVLGHTSRRTTERAYADFRGDSAFRTYDEALDEIKRGATGRRASLRDIGR